jgi:4-amino-4-deoxy-L-arabinose transferase-like glycosyltransferase
MLIISIVLAMALFLRFKFVLTVNHPPLAGDAFNYDVMVKQFLDKGFLGYMSQKPNAYVTPGYPLFLSLVYTVFGYREASPLLQVRLVQSVLGAFTCLIIYFIGKSLKNRKVGIFAAFACAVYPVFVWSPSLILTETLYTFLFLIYLYLQIKVPESKSGIIKIVCGLVFAAASMVRPALFPLLIIPYIYQYYKTKNKEVIRSFFVTASGAVLLMLPWWIRNAVTLKKLVFLATQTGNPFLGGVFPYYQDMNFTSTSSGDQLREGLKIVMKGFISKPLLYLKWFTIGKFNLIFGDMWYFPPSGSDFLVSLKLFHYVVVVTGWIGVVFSFIKKRFEIIALFVSALTLIQLVFIPEARYAYSIIPLLMILMAYVIDYLFFDSEEIGG